jgi:ATP-dependent Clp protease protease subunit
MKRQTYGVKNPLHRPMPRWGKRKAQRSEPPPRRIGPYPAIAGGFLNGRPAEPEWELVICGELTEKQFDLLDRLVEVPRGSRGTIWFDSCGGSAYVGLSLASMIRLRGLDATAVVAGECSSAAIMPFAACRKRYVTRHATLLFHPVRWHSEENVRMEEAAEWARHFQIMEKDLDDLLSKLLPLSAEALSKWTRPGRFVGGEELAAAGVAELVDLFQGDVWTQARRSTLEAARSVTETV